MALSAPYFIYAANKLGGFKSPVKDVFACYFKLE